MMFDQNDTKIRIWERSYSLKPEPQDLAVKADGTYKNTKLFAGTYNMLPYNGAYWPCAPSLPHLEASGEERMAHFTGGPTKT